MKALIIVVSVLLPLTAYFSQVPSNANSSAQAQNADSAVQAQKKALDPNTWDFGNIKKNQIVKHEFEIKNNLSRILKINDITTSCGCTASEAKKRVLAPGESTAITVQFNSKGYKGETSQFVYVTTDDPQNPVYKFTFKVFVQ
ncbi:MAG: DUF1573 domain-containing protein [Candidatus Omnitrophica bacterium]|nr:DUF1573 domain-containing protein [Candidatus Omnitrophota bacterium]